MTSQPYRTILLFGAPGVGKGTQGKVLGRLPGYCHVSSGDIFRSLDVNSPDGQEVYKYSSRGELVPDDLTIRIWKRCLEGKIATSEYRPAEDFLILDGIPRNANQARAMQGIIDVLLVVYLVSSDEGAMIDRIKRRAIRENRADDANEQVIRHRFEVYRKESEPVLECYPPEVVARVDALGTPAEVLRNVLDVLIPLQKHSQ